MIKVMKKVITLTPERFDIACADLEKKVREAGFDYDILIGIATGGSFVADRMTAPARHDVVKQRRATKSRNRFLPRLLKHLPRQVCDFLRVAESGVYSLASIIKPQKPSSVTLSDELVEALAKMPEGGRILIVDDAVDSGATLLSVVNSVRGAAPHAEVRTGALTLTRPGGFLNRGPIIKPDFLLFPEGTIIRFPWAPD